MMSRLFAENLRKFYGKNAVVDGISISINGGEVIGLLGPNGAGKTTTFYIIMGMIAADSGKIFLDDRDIGELPMFMRARAGIGYLPQESSAFKKLTVAENLIGVAEYLPIPPDAQRNAVDGMLREMNLLHIAQRKAYALSGGERRRLEIARTLITGPKFLLMDEPFSGVDPISISALQNIIVLLKNKNIGILITDHNVRETLKIVDRAYLIHGGKILCHGPREVLLNDENSRKFYLGENFDM
ncbi:MAG: LPS export ABC transporter ATP-binding protein [Puniceicoccales bacterium]|jgi:lipopolysaccharide export system ATP-binding protein|nr:LPS export ABC transporter ATP-binding protein [Puniceicoccales bacterium]